MVLYNNCDKLKNNFPVYSYFST